MRILASPELEWEIDWLRDLLGAELAGRIERTSFETVGASEDCTIITSFNLPYRALLKRLAQAGRHFAVLLLSDEMLSDATEYIDDERCAFVARNYLHPRTFSHPKSVVFGLGYKKEFHVDPASILPASRRPCVWNFMGSIHNDNRRQALAAFASLAPNFVHKTSHFNSPDYLDVHAYQSAIESSQFTLCPQGHVNIDSFRFYEALEAGSIPVVLERAPHLDARPSYWHVLFGTQEPLPFIVAPSWDEARSQAQALLASGRIDDAQRKCRLFWDQWKAIWRFRIQRRLLDLQSRG
jgi:Exostosin family